MTLMTFPFSLALMLAFSLSAFAQNVITTIAGADFSFPTQPLPALRAPIGTAGAVAVDTRGNFFVVDIDNNLVLKIDAQGTLSIFAGNGLYGFSGDGGPATLASLNDPSGVAVDSSGNLYIADASNHRIRKVTPDGIISTVAGTGDAGYTGDRGPAPAATLDTPSGIAVDRQGNLIIADTNNNVIRKVSGGTITTIAGTGDADYDGDGGPATDAAFDYPVAVAVDQVGNVYVADYNNYVVRKISAGNGRISTYAGNGDYDFAGDGGPASKASLKAPNDVAVDSAGNLFIADTDDSRIRMVTPGGIISTVAGKGSATGFSGAFSGDGKAATAAELNNPNAVAVDNAGSLYVSDGDNYRVRKVTGGIISTVAGNGSYSFAGDGDAATGTVMSGPSDVVVDPAGNIYIADTYNNRIRKISTNGIMSTVAGTGDPAYSGDGGPATAAALNGPFGLALDAAGNLFVADTQNLRIRKIGLDGRISTVAGNGVADYTGDGGPAIIASIDTPYGIALDQSGNLFIADSNNNVIRKVTPGGTISTIAGKNREGFSGDNGPATSALLNFPNMVAFDAAGNLYIADTGNNRIRKVSTAGIITTVAGSAQKGSTGDGGPATAASLNEPQGVRVDSSGQIFISDTSNHKIRKVSGGIITTIAGKGADDFSGDGGLAINAALSLPNAVTLDAAGNLLIADFGNDRVRAILAAAPPVRVAPIQLQFTASSGGSIPASQSILADSIPGLVSVVQVTSTPAGWLKASVVTGSTPLLIDITADPSKLAQGSYSGSVTITTANGSPRSSTVNVSFAVSAALPPKLTVDKQSLSFPFTQGGQARSQTFVISNAGGGSLSFTATAQTSSGGGWLSVVPASGQVPAAAPASVSVTASPAGLAPGTYAGSVTISAGSDVQTVRVTMTISAIAQAILLSQSGLSFLGISQGGVVPPQTFGVINIGTGVVNWTVKKSTLSGGPDWLLIGNASGSTDASASSVPNVSVSVNPAILAAGKYYGLVEVDAPNAANSPQFVTIFLQVLPAGADLGAVTQPSELLFTSSAANGSPGSQTATIYNLAGSTKTFRSSVTTDAGVRAAILPSEGTLVPQVPQRITVQPFTDGAAPGVYKGLATFQFSDGRTGTLRFSVVVPAKGSGSGAERGATGCNPTQLLTALTTLGQAFAVSAGWPVALGIDVKDDCGTPLEAGSVQVSFSNGDVPISLQSLKGGKWAATWQTGGGTAPVVLKIQAADSRGTLRGERQIDGKLQAQTDPPVFEKRGVVSAASLQSFAPIAPGEIISIFGDRLADNVAQSPGAPLPEQLASTTVLIGGQIAPLFYVSQNQVNALVPTSIKPNTTYQVLVQRGLTYSQPISIDVGPAQPAAFQSGGSAIAVAYRGSVAPFLVSSASPATAGDVLVIYCAGLGPTDPPVPDGVASPSFPLAQTKSPVTVTIGGQNAGVQFAGLAPGFVGLYQVNAVVPAGIAAGESVPLVLSVAGQSGPPASLAVR